jgi:hypothetical protein
VVGEFGVDDIEGLAFFNDGLLYGSTGKYSSGPATRNQLYLIDESTGDATLVASFSQFTDYEGLACLTAPTSISLAGMTAGSAASPVGWLAVAAMVVMGVVTLVVVRRRVMG